MANFTAEQKDEISYGSLFSGIGAMDKGFYDAGWCCKWQVEINQFCQRVLAKHWPQVKRFEDVKNVGKHNLQPVMAIVGGFPCQDISEANTTGAGLFGSKSGLWWEFHRVIGELRPRYVFVENVSNLSNRGIERVLGSLAEIGYDAEWEIVPACAFGAPHTRERMFIVAYSQRTEWGPLSSARRDMDNSNNGLRQGWQKSSGWATGSHKPLDRGTWASEPGICRVANGVADRMDRLTGLGNAVVPEVAEFFARLILRHLLTSA